MNLKIQILIKFPSRSEFSEFAKSKILILMKNSLKNYNILVRELSSLVKTFLIKQIKQIWQTGDGAALVETQASPVSGRRDSQRVNPLSAEQRNEKAPYVAGTQEDCRTFRLVTASTGHSGRLTLSAYMRPQRSKGWKIL